MEKIVIHGGVPLKGSIEVSGMKNAALPILMDVSLLKINVSLKICPKSTMYRSP